MASSLSWAPVARQAAATIGVLGVALCAAAAPASAAPVSLQLNYKCNFPLMLPEPLSLTITSDIPATIAKRTGTGAFQIKAVANVSSKAISSLRALEAVSVEGKATAAATVIQPDGTQIPLGVPTTIPKVTLPSSGALLTNATGKTPSISFDTPGMASIKVNDLVLTLTPRLGDGLLTGVDTFETECFQDPGQDNTLATILVTDGAADTQAPTAPGAVVGTPSKDSVALSWGASTDNVGVAGYDVYRDGSKITTVTTNSATVSGLTANTAYRFSVQARDAAGNLSAKTAETSVTTLPDEVAVENRTYAIAGSASLKTLTKGSVPLKGSINSNLTVASGAVTGDLVLDQASANLVALGFLPVSAKVAFAQTAPTTGTLKAGVLDTISKIRIKLPSVTVLGVQLAGGANCQAKQITSIALKSSGPFSTTAGGTLAGTFTISDLSGCGFLTGIVSPLTSGSGNLLALQLTPKTVA
jgi:chitodextrinase